MMMMIAADSRARKLGMQTAEGEVKGEYERIWGEEGNADYQGIVQLSEHHV